MQELTHINLTKADISEAVYRELGLSKTESCDLVNSMLNHISSALIRGESVKLAKFGTFKLIEKEERPGRNPKSGEPVVIPKRKVVTFKAAPHFISRVTSALKQTPRKIYSSKEELLALLAHKLQCNVEEVRFLFDTSEQPPAEDTLEIPDSRLSLK